MSAWLKPDTVVGISVSEPTDLVEHGLGEIHIDWAFVELVRYLLSAGATVAYGGDLRTGGYTEQMLELVRTYAWDEAPDRARVRSYLAWHVAAGLPVQDEAYWTAIATFVKVDRPEGDNGAELHLGEPGGRRRAARSFGAMRAQLAADAAAQVVLGGKCHGQIGIVPGIVEESVLALAAETALFPVGGFGGAGRVVVRALQGERADELTLDYQLEHGDENFRQMIGDLGTDVAARELDDAFERLRSAGWPYLRNGLDADENELLATTSDFVRLPALVVRGLRRLARLADG